jgi:hypothetical protein
LGLLAFYSDYVTEPTARRRMSLDDLRNDLAQVAPAKTEEDLDTFASELRLLLSSSQTNLQQGGAVLDKAAIWDRVSAEIDRHEANPAGDETDDDPALSALRAPSDPSDLDDPAGSATNPNARG